MKAIIAGATGLVGSHILRLLTIDDVFTQVDVLSRRSLNLPQKFNLLHGASFPVHFSQVDVAFSALGTTMSTAGSKAAFYHVDHDLILSFAEKSMEAGARTFVAVSSVGADPQSSNYYLKVKGETERDLEKLGFRSLVILRPSMLLGARSEFRFGELIGKGMMHVLNPLMMGPLSKYRGIHVRTVAKAMIALAKNNLEGTHVLESDRLLSFA